MYMAPICRLIELCMPFMYMAPICRLSHPYGVCRCHVEYHEDAEKRWVCGIVLGIEEGGTYSIKAWGCRWWGLHQNEIECFVVGLLVDDLSMGRSGRLPIAMQLQAMQLQACTTPVCQPARCVLDSARGAQCTFCFLLCLSMHCHHL